MMYFEEDCQLGFGSEQKQRHDPLFDGGREGPSHAVNEYSIGAPGKFE